MSTKTLQRFLVAEIVALLIVGFAPLALARIYNPGVGGTVSIASGGTGTTTFITGQPIFYNGTTLTSTSSLSTAFGGTGTSTQVSNGVNYYDGSKITSSASLLSFNGTALGISSSTPSGSFSVHTGATNDFVIGTDASFSNFSILSFNGSRSDTAGLGFVAGGDSNLYQQVPTGGAFVFRPNGVSGGVNAANTVTFSGAKSVFLTGILGIGSSTPVANFQVTNSSANATTTAEFGKPGQTKGTCFKMYDAVGTAAYVSVTGTTLVVSASACASVTGF